MPGLFWFWEGDQPAPVGAGAGWPGEELPPMGKFAEPKLSDVAHAREGVLQLAQFTVEPALVQAVFAQVWLQQ